MRSSVYSFRILAVGLSLFLHALTAAAQPAPAGETDDSNRLLYAQTLAQAQLEWAAGDVARMTRLLEGCPPAVRQWEWHYLRRLADGAALTFHGHRSPVTALAWAPDGRRGASGGEGGTVHVWDADTGQIFFSLHGHRGGVGALAFTPDGKFLITANGKFHGGATGVKVVEPSEVRLWDAASGQFVKTWTGHDGLVERLVIAPDGKSLVAVAWTKIGEPPALHVWNIEANKTAGKVPASAGSFLDIAPDGQLVLLALGAKDDEPNRLRFLAPDTLKHTRSCPMPRGLWGVSLRPDARRVAAMLDNAERLAIWNTDTGEELLRVPAKGTSLSYSGDGKRLAVLNGSAVDVYEAETGKMFGSLRDREDWPTVPIWSPDGRRLLTAPQPYSLPPHEAFFGTVKVWDLGVPRGGEPLVPEYRTVAGHRGQVRALAFRHDGRQFASGDEEGTVLLCDAATGRVLHALTQKDGGVRVLRFTPDGKRLLVVSRTRARSWDTATGKEVRSHEVGNKDWQAISPDGYWLASSESLRALDRDQSLPLPEVRGNGVIGMDFSADGKFLVAGYGGIPGMLQDGSWGPHIFANQSSPGPVVVWDAATGKEVRRLQGLRDYVWPYRPVFSRDGKLVAASCGKWGVQLWDVATGAPHLRLLGRDRDETGGLAFSPDRRRLFVATARAVDVWDLTSGRQVLTLRVDGHGLALSPDGTCVAVGGRGEVRLYDSVAALAPAAALRRQAVARVRALYDQGLLHDEVLARLTKAGDADAVVLDVARGSAENAVALREAAWAVARKRGAREADYRAALARAERAVQLNVDDPRAKLAAGAAYYRLGDYKNAVKVLAGASTIAWEGVTGTLTIRPHEVHAFLGLAQFHLSGDGVAHASIPLNNFVVSLERQRESLEKYRRLRGDEDAAAVARRLHFDDQCELLPEVEEVLKRTKEKP
jgi:WD40 repeat protein